MGDQHVFVANHVSWLDIPVVAAHLRAFKFVAKAELKRIPIFGRAAAAAGTVYGARFTIGDQTVDLVAGVPLQVATADRWSPDVVPDHTVWAGRA